MFHPFWNPFYCIIWYCITIWQRFDFHDGQNFPHVVRFMYINTPTQRRWHLCRVPGVKGHVSCLPNFTWADYSFHHHMYIGVLGFIWNEHHLLSLQCWRCLMSRESIHMCMIHIFTSTHSLMTIACDHLRCINVWTIPRHLLSKDQSSRSYP